MSETRKLQQQKKITFETPYQEHLKIIKGIENEANELKNEIDVIIDAQYISEHLNNDNIDFNDLLNAARIADKLTKF